MKCFIQVGSNIKLISNEDEAAEAVRNILGSSTAEPERKRPKKAHIQQQLRGREPETMDPLQKCAEEILAGVKRPTAVEGSVVHFLLPDKQSGQKTLFSFLILFQLHSARLMSLW